MTPHKDPAKLPVDRQLGLIRNDLDKVKWDVGGIKVKLKNHDKQFELIKSDLKFIKNEARRVDKRFDEQLQLFEKWKNEILTAIDKSFTKPIMDLQTDHAAQQVRLEEHQIEIDKLKVQCI